MIENPEPVEQEPQASSRKHWSMEIPNEGSSERFFSWLEKEKDVSPRIRISIEVTWWLVRVDAFRQKEEELLISGKYQVALPSHRPAILNLISEGEKLILVARERGLSDQFALTIEDLEATVETLHVTFRTQHRNNLPPARKQAIADLLGVS